MKKHHFLELLLSKLKTIFLRDFSLLIQLYSNTHDFMHIYYSTMNICMMITCRRGLVRHYVYSFTYLKIVRGHAENSYNHYCHEMIGYSKGVYNRFAPVSCYRFT